MSTKLCENCLIKVNYVNRFRELCAATEVQMRVFLEFPGGESDETFQSAVDTLNELTAHAAEMGIPDGENVMTRKRKHTEMDSCDLET